MDSSYINQAALEKRKALQQAQSSGGQSPADDSTFFHNKSNRVVTQPPTAAFSSPFTTPKPTQSTETTASQRSTTPTTPFSPSSFARSLTPSNFTREDTPPATKSSQFTCTTPPSRAQTAQFPQSLTEKSQIRSSSAHSAIAVDAPDKGSNSFSRKTTVLDNSVDGRWQWLIEVRDCNGTLRGEPGYDPTTLYIPKREFARLTATRRQYWEYKMSHFDTIVFFQVLLTCD